MCGSSCSYLSCSHFSSSSSACDLFSSSFSGSVCSLFCLFSCRTRSLYNPSWSCSARSILTLSMLYTFPLQPLLVMFCTFCTVSLHVRYAPLAVLLDVLVCVVSGSFPAWPAPCVLRVPSSVLPDHVVCMFTLSSVVVPVLFTVFFFTFLPLTLSFLLFMILLHHKHPVHHSFKCFC